MRIGNESIKATPTELKRLVLRGNNMTCDSQSTLYKVNDYAFSKLRERYKKWTGRSFDNKDLISFGLADENGYLTYAGALIADDSPVRYSSIFKRWNGLTKSGGILDAFDDRLEIYSSGWMPDGSNIQERDPITVPSTRRTPVLADIFNRLGYIERKGSGLGR